MFSYEIYVRLYRVKHKIILVSWFLVVKCVHRSWPSLARVAGVFLLYRGLLYLHGNCASCMK